MLRRILVLALLLGILPAAVRALPRGSEPAAPAAVHPLQDWLLRLGSLLLDGLWKLATENTCQNAAKHPLNAAKLQMAPGPTTIPGSQNRRGAGSGIAVDFPGIAAEFSSRRLRNSVRLSPKPGFEAFRACFAADSSLPREESEPASKSA